MAINITRTHDLSRTEVRRRADALAAEMGGALGLKTRWEGDRITFKGPGVKGHMDVAEQAIHIYVHKGRFVPVSEAWIQEQIEDYLDQHLPAPDTPPTGTGPAAQAAAPPPEPPPKPEDASLSEELMGLAGSAFRFATHLGHAALDAIDEAQQKAQNPKNPPQDQ